MYKISFNKQINHINDNHILFEASLHFCEIWPTVCCTCLHCCDLTEIPEILRRFSPPLASKGNFEGFPSKTNNWILIKLHVSTTCNKSKSSYDVSSFSCRECGIEICSFNHHLYDKILLNTVIKRSVLNRNGFMKYKFF